MVTAARLRRQKMLGGGATIEPHAVAPPECKGNRSESCERGGDESFKAKLLAPAFQWRWKGHGGVSPPPAAGARAALRQLSSGQSPEQRAEPEQRAVSVTPLVTVSCQQGHLSSERKSPCLRVSGELSRLTVTVCCPRGTWAGSPSFSKWTCHSGERLPAVVAKIKFGFCVKIRILGNVGPSCKLTASHT